MDLNSLIKDIASTLGHLTKFHPVELAHHAERILDSIVPLACKIWGLEGESTRSISGHLWNTYLLCEYLPAGFVE
jgi:hypothetical protein